MNRGRITIHVRNIAESRKMIFPLRLWALDIVQSGANIPASKGMVAAK